MKIVLIGLGSIGQRHLRNLLFLGYNQVSVVSRSGILPGEFSFLPVYSSLESALASNSFDAAIICTPTSLHLASLGLLLEANIPKIYLEKPVSHSYEGIETFLSSGNIQNKTIIVGYDLHFDPGIQKVKQLLSDNVVGKVVSVNAFVGQFLPDWRPTEDYRNGMSARKASGGGVMLDLIHEFDYLLWLIGPIESVACNYTTTGALEIETEDVCDVLLKFKNGATGSLHLDYLQRELVRNCLITGSKGTIHLNLAENKVSWVDANKCRHEYGYHNFQRNDRFLEIIKSFIENDDDPRLTKFAEGLESLQFVLAAKKSSETGEFVHFSLINPTVKI